MAGAYDPKMKLSKAFQSTSSQLGSAAVKVAHPATFTVDGHVYRSQGEVDQAVRDGTIRFRL